MNGQNCMNMASAEAQALVKRYGEETVEAMSSAVANKGPVVIRDAQGQAVESLLYRDLKKAMGDNLKAWERYMDIMLKPPQGELDKNGEPVYKKSMLAEPTKPKAPGPEKLERKELSQQDIVNETLNSKLKALEKSISKTVQRYQDVDSFKYKKLLRQYADDVSKANVIKFLLYTNGYTYYMSNYLTDALAETSKYRETFAENAQRFRRFLDLTEEINSLDSLAIMDRDMSDFIKDNDLAGMLEGIVKERARISNTLAQAEKEYGVLVLSEKSKRMHTKFENEKRKQYYDTHIRDKNLSKQDLEAEQVKQDNWVQEQMDLNADVLQSRERNYVRQIVNAKIDGINLAEAWFVDPAGINDDIIQYANQELNRADFDTRQAVIKTMEKGAFPFSCHARPRVIAFVLE